MAGTRRLDQLIDRVSNRVHLPDGELVVALSGGGDSAALAHLCQVMGHVTDAVHINHGLPYSTLMEKAAIAIAEMLDVNLEVVFVDVPGGASPEGQARRARYAAFCDVRRKVLTAHTRDDEVETVLFNLIRGTGPRGMAGIPHFRPPNIYRPMLDVTRSETREIAALVGLPFVDDPMNDAPNVTRNVIRSKVIPMLSEINPRLSESIARMAAAIAPDDEYLDREAARVRLVHGDDSVAVAVGQLLALALPIADRVLKTMLTYTVGGGGLTAERVHSLWAVARAEIVSCQIEAGVIARRVGPLLVIESLTAKVDTRPVLLTPGTHRLGRLEFEVVAARGTCRVFPLSRWSAVFPAGTELVGLPDGAVTANGEPAWVPGVSRLPVAWYVPGTDGYLSVSANEVTGWTSER